MNRHLVRERGHLIRERGHLVCERGHPVRKHRRLIGGQLSGLCWLEGLHRLNRRGLCGIRHGLHWRGLLCRGGLGRWRGSLSRFKNLPRNIQYDDQTHNRQQQQRPHIFTFHKFFRLVVCVWSPPTGSALQPFDSQTTGRAGLLLWGVTLTRFEKGRPGTAYGT